MKRDVHCCKKSHQCTSILPLELPEHRHHHILPWFLRYILILTIKTIIIVIIIIIIIDITLTNFQGNCTICLLVMVSITESRQGLFSESRACHTYSCPIQLPFVYLYVCLLVSQEKIYYAPGERGLREEIFSRYYLRQTTNHILACRNIHTNTRDNYQTLRLPLIVATQYETHQVVLISATSHLHGPAWLQCEEQCCLQKHKQQKL